MKLTTNNFKLHLCRQFAESLSEAANTIYYVFIGKSSPWDDENVPPTPYDNVNTLQIEAYEQMIAAKKVAINDVQLMVNRYDWQSNTVYTQYTHDDPLLLDKKYFVNIPRGGFYDVFKCLSNNRGIPSTDPPDYLFTSPQDEIYRTLDGYQWKYMYSVDKTTFDKFSTTTLMPVIPNSNVTANAISGTIDYVEVVSGGSNYDTYANGTIQVSAANGDDRLFQVESTKSSNGKFYVGCAFYISSGTGAGQQRTVIDYIVSGNLRYIKVDEPFDVIPTTNSRYEINPRVLVAGDGDGFIGRALVNAASSNSIYQVEIVNRGSGFSYASANATLTTGVAANAALFKPIISPQYGHGYDVATELGAKTICISTTFNSSDSENNMKLLDTNQYRTIGLIKDPLFANVVLTFVNNTNVFVDGETVTQSNTNATGIVTSITPTTVMLTDVRGYFKTGNSTVNVITSTGGTTATVTGVVQPTTYIDQTYKIAIDNINGDFLDDEIIMQLGANATFYAANTTVMRVTEKRGTYTVSDDATLTVERVEGLTSGATAKVTGVFPGDFVVNSGHVLYIENMSPVTRVANQSEVIKLLLQF